MSALHSPQFDNAGPDQSSRSWHEQALGGLAAELRAFRASRPSTTSAISQLVPWTDRDSDAAPAESAAATAVQPSPAAEGALSPSQTELLRLLTLAEAPVPADDLDGRVLRALCRRGLAIVGEGHAGATEEGRHYFQSRVRKRRRIRTERHFAAEATERAEVILQVVRQLESVLPRTMRHAVGDLTVETPDLLAALEEYAEQLRSGLSPAGT